MAQAKRSTLNLAAFAAPCLPLAAFGLPLVITLPRYYSETLGLSGSAVGLAFLLVRFLDIGFDPIFGVVMDRTQTRWGRFKPWFVLGTPITLLGVAMLFLARPGVGPVYLWLGLLVTYIGFSICVLAQTSWAATLTTDYNDRSRVYAFWQAGNVIGMVLVLLLPVALTFLHLISGSAEQVRSQGWFIILLMPLTVALAVWRVNEPRPIGAESVSTASLADYLRMLGRPTVVRILLVDLLMGLAPSIAGTLFFFYFIRVKAFTETAASELLLIYFLAAIVGAPIWTLLANRIGKAATLMASCVIYALVQFATIAMPAFNPALPVMSLLLAMPFVVFAGLPYSAAPLLARSMMADYSDEERLESGVDRTGVLYAILTGTVKIGGALAVGVMIILEWLGFSAAHPAASTPGGMMSLQAFYAFAPAVIGLLAAWSLVGYPLSAAKHAEIRRQLAERDRTDHPSASSAANLLESDDVQTART
jgi:GPH family glycoside/pentoside/hexuronide:cation symporter